MCSLIYYRPFRNTDPPLLTELWRSCADRRSLVQPLSIGDFEQLVLNKPYFDREGLWLAIEDEQPIGFVHAGFGPSEDESTLSTELGVTSMIVLRPRSDPEVASQLLGHSEAYLRQRGAKVIYGGAVRPLNPFYLGLYGGSEQPGILDSDSVTQQLFLTHGYREIDRTVVFRRTLSDFRAPADRNQMQVRRRTQLAVVDEPPTKTWWEACTLGEFERVEFQLLGRNLGEQLASATLRSVDQSSTNAGVRTSGLVDVRVAPQALHQGLATFLLSEVLKELHQHGVGIVEAQTMQRNTAAIGLYRKLGFDKTDSGAVYRKE